jgi:hypothetical protein
MEDSNGLETVGLMVLSQNIYGAALIEWRQMAPNRDKQRTIATNRENRENLAKGAKVKGAKKRYDRKRRMQGPSVQLY